MTRTWPFLTCLLLLSGEETPRFEIADVHVSARTANPYRKGPFIHGGRYEVRTATMVDLIGLAYGVDAVKVWGGPSWIEMDRFDMVAKTPANSTPETRKMMLQALLADRFKLVVHNDNKPVLAYGLTVGKHPINLKASEGAG